jgi:hypothetical protein
MSVAVMLLTALAPAWTVAQTQPKPDDEKPLPKLIEMPLPSAEELLRSRAFDWIVLLNGDVLVVEAVPYRPNTLKTLQQQYDELLKSRPAGMDPDERRRKLAELQRLQVTLVDGGEEPDYLLETRFIDRIVYFEDLVLKRAAALMDARQLTAAYELLMFVDRRHRGWPEFTTHYHRFLFLEATRLTELGQDEQAWVLLERLFGLDAKYPQLSEQLGAVSDRFISTAVEAEDFRRARHFLTRLERLIADHSMAKRWRERLTALASDAVTAARAATAEGNRRAAIDLLDRAARVWPELPGLKDAHREATARYQIVHAGVVNPAPAVSAQDDAHAQRRRQLCEIPLFEPDRLQDGVVRYRSAFIESWEPRDLGRELQFQLRPRRAPWESRPVLTAGMIVDSLTARLEAGRRSGDDRWSANVRSVEAQSPWEWRLSLGQIPLRVEGWLRVTVPLNADAAAWNTDLQAAAWSAPLEQRFFLAEQQEDSVSFQRTRPQQDAASPRYADEVRERAYPDWDRLLQGLNRGEIDLAPVVEWRDLPALQQDNRFFVLQTALPRTHVVLVHPRSIAAQNGPLRRALLHALPRDELLRQNVLENSGESFGRTVNSPFATTTYAYDSRLRQPEHSFGLATSLAATAKKELGGTLPLLKLQAPADPVVARVLPVMLAHWKRAGLDVQMAVADASTLGGWDLKYVTVSLTEPYVDLWTLISPDGPLDWAALQVYPHWMREQLLTLERTVDWTTAVRLLQRIQAEFLVEARWLPLWEVDDYMVVRRRITGLPTRPMQTYHGIERWTVQSWYPTDTP